MITLQSSITMSYIQLVFNFNYLKNNEQIIFSKKELLDKGDSQRE